MDYIQQITDLGYCKIENVYTEEEIAKTLALVKEWEKKAPIIDDEYVPRLNKGFPNLYNLQNKDKYFLDILFKSDEVEEILCYFLNDIFYKQIPLDQPNYILRSFGARSNGKEALPFHIDSFVPVGNPCLAMQVAIFLEDSTIENGCTVVRPGSHLWGTYACQYLNYVEVSAKKGDILIWNSSLHHGSLRSEIDITRWACIATYCRYWMKQAFDIPKSLPFEILVQLTPKQKSVLGFNSNSHYDENFGIDLKRGYE